jgi:hypothetical protein
MPVVGEAILELEPLAGEALVCGSGVFGDVVHFAEGAEDHVPDERARRPGHARGAQEMVGVDHPERGRCGDIADDGDGDIAGPDVFAGGVSGRVGLGDDAVAEIVEKPVKVPVGFAALVTLREASRNLAS